ncbi:hypothetical protein MTO96_023451 [Rhipicephalus appendiculatus]
MPSCWATSQEPGRRTSQILTGNIRTGSTKANAPSQAPSSRGMSPRVSAVPQTKSRDLSSPSHFSKRYQQCGAKVEIVEKDAGGFAKMGNDGKRAKACSIKEDRGGQRRTEAAAGKTTEFQVP